MELMQSPKYLQQNLQNRFNEAVQEYKEKHKVDTISDMAKLMGVSEKLLTECIIGGFKVSLEDFIKVCIAMGIVPDINFK